MKCRAQKIAACFPNNLRPYHPHHPCARSGSTRLSLGARQHPPGLDSNDRGPHFRPRVVGPLSSLVWLSVRPVMAGPCCFYTGGHDNLPMIFPLLTFDSSHPIQGFRLDSHSHEGSPCVRRNAGDLDPVGPTARPGGQGRCRTCQRLPGDLISARPALHIADRPRESCRGSHLAGASRWGSVPDRLFDRSIENFDGRASLGKARRSRPRRELVPRGISRGGIGSPPRRS